MSNYYVTTRIGDATAFVVDTRDFGGACDIRLIASSKVNTMTGVYGLKDNDFNPNEEIEVARLNAAVFDMDKGEHQGWEYSDTYSTAVKSDTRADIIQFKDGSILVGDIDKDNVDLDQIKWAYSGSHVILKDGEDVAITASWRTKYVTGKYTWSFFASRADGTYVFGALKAGETCNATELRNYLKLKDCVNAMVNDGGGSAELVVEGKIVNGVTTERRIANALFIYEKKNQPAPNPTDDKDAIISDLRTQLALTLGEIDQLSTELEQVKADKATADEENESLRSQLDEKIVELDNLSASMMDLTDSNFSLHRQIDDLNNEITRLNAELAAARNTQSGASAEEVAMLNDTIAALSERLYNIKEYTDKIVEELNKTE